MTTLPRIAVAMGLLLSSSAWAHPGLAHNVITTPAVLSSPAFKPAARTPAKSVMRHAQWRQFEGATRLAVPLAARAGDTLVLDDAHLILMDRFDNHAWLQHADGRRERVDVLWTL